MPSKRPTVEIFCSDRSHESRRVTVAVFERRRDGTQPPSKVIDWPGVLSMVTGGKPQPWEEMSVTSRGVLDMDKHTGQDLDAADKPMPPAADEDQPPVDRWRYSLACKLCGLTVPARGERLYPVLDQLADFGVLEVSLSGLAATLRRQ